MRRLIRKQQKYDKYEIVKNDLQMLEENLSSLNQDLEQDLERLKKLQNQATSSSTSNSAISNDDCQ